MADFDISSYFAEKTSLGCGKYQASEVPAINVLFVGRSQAGKTAIVDTILNPMKGVQSTGFSDTRDPRFHSLVVRNLDTGEDHQLNIIDTPGLQEVRKSGEENRRDQELLALAANFIKEQITNLNVVCFVTAAGTTHLQDIKVFEEIQKFLGPEFSDITMMILTHCDEYGEDTLKQFEVDIREHETSKPIAEFCKLGIFRYGSIDRSKMTSLLDLDKDTMTQILTQKLKHIEGIRNTLLDKFVSLSSNQLPIKGLLHIKKQSDDYARKLIEEAFAVKTNKENEAKDNDRSVQQDQPRAATSNPTCSMQ